MQTETTAQENVKRKVTIDYSEFDYMGVKEMYCYVQLFLHKSDGSKLIVLEVPFENQD